MEKLERILSCNISIFSLFSRYYCTSGILRNKMKQPFSLKGLQMLSNDKHSSRLIFFIENLYCSIWQKVLTGFSAKQKSSIGKIRYIKDNFHSLETVRKFQPKRGKMVRKRPRRVSGKSEAEDFRYENQSSQNLGTSGGNIN